MSAPLLPPTDSPPRIPIPIAVTGHRRIPAEEVAALRARVAVVLTALQERYAASELLLLSGLAEGADRLVAEVAHEHGIPVVGVLPMPAADYRADFGDAVDAFEQSLAACRSVIELPGPAGPAPAARDACYARLGDYLARHGLILLAL